MFLTKSADALVISKVELERLVKLAMIPDYDLAQLRDSLVQMEDVKAWAETRKTLDDFNYFLSELGVKFPDI